ncbi:lantibiotic dehydratase [Algoriphagus halophytocola]|uniref:lantibiotic dehydratase n=1 Tax=Algoriphagus halophytocola TaxID=2991499 RepID=UPI0022DDC6B1|nr:lantibiotic dehydratase [Algoriphagus sp. TR-M9]WBL43030.1 lantibiotic dehydratase [Algoriphagus sp. TR-M9]
MQHFLFRAPLLTIDPRDETEIISNWESILSILSVSSPSLLQALGSTPYVQLHPRLKKKVYKYLLRGRYRCTPFGMLAGVGIGRINNSQQFDIDLSRVIPLSNSKNVSFTERKHFFLAEVIYEKWDRLHFLTFQENAKRWGLVNLPKNRLFEQIIKKVGSRKITDFEKFSAGFNNPESSYEKAIWEKMVKLGILYPADQRKLQTTIPNLRKDMAILEEITIPQNTLEEIRDFKETAGALFTSTRSAYLNLFSDWFEDKFDDRFVPLQVLLTYDEFVNSVFLDNLAYSNKEQKTGVFPLGIIPKQTIDLKRNFPSKRLDSAIYDLQVVIKLRRDASIMVDNLVCNRPFVYFGRFNKHERILAEQKKIKDTIYRDREVIYAELKLYETENVASICSSVPIFKTIISPFPETEHESLTLDDIELGNMAGEFMLVHKKTRKKVIPVITHPLNGEEISHPILRLLWEISHQDSFMFSPYFLRKNMEVSYLPQLNWGNIILQSRRWLIHSDSFLNMKNLNQWLRDNSVPNPLVMGYLDRELVLHWDKLTDLEILWEELKKWKKLVLSDPVWLSDSMFQSTSARAIYPQLVVHQSITKKEVPLPDFINSLSSIADNSLYILIRISENSLFTFLEFFFCGQMLNLLKKENVEWYYVVYPGRGHLQLRVRFLRLLAVQKSKINKMILLKHGYSDFLYEVRPYYPEYKKYGTDDYMKSEQLFHLESSLMLLPTIENPTGLIQNNRNLKLGLMSQLWMRVFLETGVEHLFFTILKHRVKSLSRNELKELRSYNEELKNEEKDHSNYLNWQNSYYATVEKHSFLFLDDLTVKRFLLNHIHMQVNRFFPVDRKKMEDLIHYRLYTLLGKQLYSP